MSQTASRSVQLCSNSLRQRVPITMGRPLSHQNCPIAWGSVTPFNAWFLGPTRVHTVRPMLSDRCLSCPVCLCDVGVLWPNGWMDQDATRYGSRPRTRRHCARWESSSPNKGHSTHHFSAHVYCGQTAGCIKMPLGTEVDLGPGHTVLDGDLAHPLLKGTVQPSLFGPCLLWPNGRPSQLLLSTCHKT